jgi:hypothetical protein
MIGIKALMSSKTPKGEAASIFGGAMTPGFPHTGCTPYQHA